MYLGWQTLLSIQKVKRIHCVLHSKDVRCIFHVFACMILDPYIIGKLWMWTQKRWRCEWNTSSLECVSSKSTAENDSQWSTNISYDTIDYTTSQMRSKVIKAYVTCATTSVHLPLQPAHWLSAILEKKNGMKLLPSCGTNAKHGTSTKNQIGHTISLM